MTYASKAGFAQDVALINDRYGSFLLSEQHITRHNLSKEAEHHLDIARTSYERWGSMRSLKQVGATNNVIGTSTKSLKMTKKSLVEKKSTN